MHFWIGSNSSQDEQGAAAALTTQMDDHLKGLPTQYRETEGYESKKFKSYFPGGILIKEGGVHSGFNHVEVNDYTDIRRLLHVKGKKNVIAREVPLRFGLITSPLRQYDVIMTDFLAGHHSTTVTFLLLILVRV